MVCFGSEKCAVLICNKTSSDGHESHMLQEILNITSGDEIQNINSSSSCSVRLSEGIKDVEK